MEEAATINLQSLDYPEWVVFSYIDICELAKEVNKIISMYENGDCRSLYICVNCELLNLNTLFEVITYTINDNYSIEYLVKVDSSKLTHLQRASLRIIWLRQLKEKLNQLKGN